MPYGPAGRRLVWALIGIIVLELVLIVVTTLVSVR